MNYVIELYRPNGLIRCISRRLEISEFSVLLDQLLLRLELCALNVPIGSTHGFGLRGVIIVIIQRVSERLTCMSYTNIMTVRKTIIPVWGPFHV